MLLVEEDSLILILFLTLHDGERSQCCCFLLCLDYGGFLVSVIS